MEIEVVGMKKIGEFMSMNEQDECDLFQSFVSALSNPNFKEYVSLLGIEDELLMKYTSRLEDACKEFQHCKNCSGLSQCQNVEKGFVLTPERQMRTITFSYVACPYLQKLRKEQAYQDNISLFDIPKQIMTATMKNIYKDDINRKEVIKFLISFMKDYLEHKKTKGLYLHGSFGSGKTYLIAAMFNELAKKNVKSAIVYYPEFLRSLKESFSSDYKEKYDFIKKVPLLLLDDIGAENLTPWSRDEVLGPLLQYRMNQELPTFFTSNLTLSELEQHLSNSSNGVEKVKARRIIERMKELTCDIELVSKNRRSYE